MSEYAIVLNQLSKQKRSLLITHYRCPDIIDFHASKVHISKVYNRPFCYISVGVNKPI